MEHLPQFQLAIISSHNDFYRRMKFLEAHGFPRNAIIDGRVFQVPNLDFPRLLAEGVAYGVLDKNSFKEQTMAIYRRVYRIENYKANLLLGVKSYMNGSTIEGTGTVSIGNFSSIAFKTLFELRRNEDHNWRTLGSYSLRSFDWKTPERFFPPQEPCKILIGNDVWIGRGSILKCTNPNRPLVIGDGAVIASDSVVVKNVPPYAIVGGNPAKIIKFRFSEDVIESLLRIKWWDWSLDKIHDNFKYFNDIDKFIALHDK